MTLNVSYSNSYYKIACIIIVHRNCWTCSEEVASDCGPRHCQVTTLGKLFTHSLTLTHTCLCYQEVHHRSEKTVLFPGFDLHRPWRDWCLLSVSTVTLGDVQPVPTTLTTHCASVEMTLNLWHTS